MYLIQMKCYIVVLYKEFVMSLKKTNTCCASASASSMNKTKSFIILVVLAETLLCFNKMSHCMGKPTICIGENKGADQLRSNCEADQRLCFRYMDSIIPLLPSSEISSF